MITVLIPDRGTTGYTLYAAGNNLSRPVHFPEDKGFRIAFEGTVMLFYTFDGTGRKHRKAYVMSENSAENAAELECVDRKLGFIYMAEGRKVDLLKRLMHYIGGDKEVYGFSAFFWKRLTRLIDMDFNGKESALTRERYRKMVAGERLRMEMEERHRKPCLRTPEKPERPAALTFARLFQ